MAYEGLIRSGRKAPIYQPGPGSQRVTLHRPEIERLVPHRPPMLLIDAVDGVDLEARCIEGRRRIDPGDPVFAGHFPGEPVYPGVLLLETMAQLCICLQQLHAAGSVELPARSAPLRLRLLRVHHAIFLAEVRPGDELRIVAKLLEETGYTSVLAGQVLRGDTICAFTILEAYLLDDESREGA